MRKQKPVAARKRPQLVPLVGDGEEAVKVGTRIRKAQDRYEERCAVRGVEREHGHSLSDDSQDAFSEELRTARYRDWDKERRTG